MYFLGIDIGSLSCDAVLIDINKNILSSSVILTGVKNIEAIANVKKNVIESSGVLEKDIQSIISTGYGRSRVEGRPDLCRAVWRGVGCETGADVATGACAVGQLECRFSADPGGHERHRHGGRWAGFVGDARLLGGQGAKDYRLSFSLGCATGLVTQIYAASGSGATSGRTGGAGHGGGGSGLGRVRAGAVFCPQPVGGRPGTACDCVLPLCAGGTGAVAGDAAAMAGLAGAVVGHRIGRFDGCWLGRLRGGG